MNDKKILRKHYRDLRNRISAADKSVNDRKIFENLINCELYSEAETILIYVSVKGEPETLNIIKHALAENKNVAVPLCTNERMDFRLIKTTDDLSDGLFGIPEPDPLKCSVVTDFSNSLCVVPALAFDVSGNRLGYGGGYYDRFLSEHKVSTVGLCYEKFLCHALPDEEHDIKVDFILNENGLRNSKKEVST